MFSKNCTKCIKDVHDQNSPFKRDTFETPAPQGRQLVLMIFLNFFTPDPCKVIQFGQHIFQMGSSNHQLN